MQRPVVASGWLAGRPRAHTSWRRAAGRGARPPGGQADHWRCYACGGQRRHIRRKRDCAAGTASGIRPQGPGPQRPGGAGSGTGKALPSRAWKQHRRGDAGFVTRPRKDLQLRAGSAQPLRPCTHQDKGKLAGKAASRRCRRRLHGRLRLRAPGASAPPGLWASRAIRSSAGAAREGCNP